MACYNYVIKEIHKQTIYMYFENDKIRIHIYKQSYT